MDRRVDLFMIMLLSIRAYSLGCAGLAAFWPVSGWIHLHDRRSTSDFECWLSAKPFLAEVGPKRRRAAALHGVDPIKSQLNSAKCFTPTKAFASAAFRLFDL